MPEFAEQSPGVTEISLLQVVSSLLRGRRFILRAVVFLVALVTALSILGPRKFTSEAMFAPQSASAGLGQLAALAAQFSFALPGMSGGESPDFYVALVRSPEILGRVVDTRYEVRAPSRWMWWRDPVGLSGTLIDVFEIREDDALKGREKAIERLSENMSVSAGRTTGIVTVRVRTRWPELSRAIATTIIDFVNEFNVNSRQSQAAAERIFSEARLAEAKRELREAEDILQLFLNRNRDFGNSPQLVFQNERLRREVDLRQQIVLGVSQAFEQARIAEVRNTPVITVVQRPQLPARPDRRRLFLKGFLSAVFGFLASAAVVVIRDTLRERRERDPREIDQIEHVRDEILQDLRRLRPWGKRPSGTLEA